jgi:hypothetical protein
LKSNAEEFPTLKLNHYAIVLLFLLKGASVFGGYQERPSKVAFLAYYQAKE